MQWISKKSSKIKFEPFLLKPVILKRVHCILLWKKISICSFSGVDLASYSVMILPAGERSLSHGTLVATMPKYVFAKWDNSGSLFSCTFYQANGYDAFCTNGSDRWISISCWILLFFPLDEDHEAEASIES